ncbi:hypothetical protein OHA72_16110 [Dactylosporangium sp. NBC_01737]|uniref:hypothetical protein n=1 Tax=Dactylosporangium sp. NBC_01737 TaxID=2975959 RepID=UPI002E0E2410|nr:hypothetical protein OHA72_16110 [Dactylosporangium sp. NBC_01737]
MVTARAAKGLDVQTIGGVYGQIVQWAQAGEFTFGVERSPCRPDGRGHRAINAGFAAVATGTCFNHERARWLRTVL